MKIQVFHNGNLMLTCHKAFHTQYAKLKETFKHSPYTEIKLIKE